MRNKGRLVNLIFIIFAVIGGIFMAVGIFQAFASSRFKQKAVEVRAVISSIESYRDSDGDMSHRVYVSYSYGGNRYEDVRLGEYSSSMRKGGEIKLMIDPDDPEKARTGFGMILLPTVFSGMGLIFVCVGLIPLIVMGKRAAATKKLIQAGHYIWATVESIDYNTSYSVNGQHPYVVYCTYRDEYRDVTYRFKSDNIWTNPQSVITCGSEIKIFVDRQNYKNYHVDIEGVLQGRIVDYT